MSIGRFAVILCLILTCSPVNAHAGSLVSNQVHAVSLEHNLLGDSPDRNVKVYLPTGYRQQTKVRYPVVYLLHGFNGTTANRLWTGRGTFWQWNIRKAMDKLIEEGKVLPMIIVMPDCSNKYGGSFYTNSVTTGNWEDFITTDLVKYIDAKYRTLPAAASRGIAGHSMGGYGAIKLAMKHPEIFGVVYGLSACCLSWDAESHDDKVWNKILVFKTVEEADEAGFLTHATFAMSAAWSPNPSKAPFFADFPYSNNKGSLLINEEVQARWSANHPVAMADQYRTNLLRLRAIAFDVGRQDHLLPVQLQFADVLKRNQVPYTFEEYEGDHNNKLQERVETRMLPFFSRMLVFQALPTKKR